MTCFNWSCKYQLQIITMQDCNQQLDHSPHCTVATQNPACYIDITHTHFHCQSWKCFLHNHCRFGLSHLVCSYIVPLYFDSHYHKSQLGYMNTLNKSYKIIKWARSLEHYLLEINWLLRNYEIMKSYCKSLL